MRRSDREIKDPAIIDAVIRGGQVCRLGLCDGDEPYVVPMCFGYDGKVFYFHGSLEGRKIDVLKKNNRVCVEFDIVDRIEEAEQACNWGMMYKSVIAVGTAEILQDLEAKRRGLSIIMKQYSSEAYTFPDQAVTNICVIKVNVERMTGKQRQ